MNTESYHKPQPPATPSKRAYFKHNSPGTPKALARSPYAEGYIEAELLGRGSYAVVKKCQDRKTGEFFAVKKIDLLQGLTYRKAGERETRVFDLLKNQPHPNIVKCHKHWEESSHIYILLEQCNGSLANWQASPYTQQQLVDIKRQIASGLSLLHKLSCPHGDIKPSNILVSRNTEDSSLLTYKLADLGTKTGDGQYLAPEMLDTPKPKNRYPVDIFALGMSLYRLGYGQALWDKKQPCVDTSQIQPEEIFLPQTEFTPQFVSLLQKMMSKCPEDRPQAMDLLQEEELVQEFEDASQSESLSQSLSSSWPWPVNDENNLRRSGSFERLSLCEVTPPRDGESQRRLSLKRSAGSPRRTTPPKKLRLSLRLNL